jgi:RNA polymerase sigma-70 factor (ECF subfamily)
LTEKEIINGCKRRNKTAQKELYCTYVTILRGICHRYANNRDEANDIIQEGFIKVYSNIKQYKGRGSFEGWLKRIFINAAISYYKKKVRNGIYSFQDINETEIINDFLDNNEGEDDFEIDKNKATSSEQNKNLVYRINFNENELLEILKTIPLHFQIVFNLYFIDGFKHKEIATKLGINEKTSRTRLSRARKLLQQELFKSSIKKMTVKSN